MMIAFSVFHGLQITHISLTTMFNDAYLTFTIGFIKMKKVHYLASTIFNKSNLETYFKIARDMWWFVMKVTIISYLLDKLYNPRCLSRYILESNV